MLIEHRVSPHSRLTDILLTSSGVWSVTIMVGLSGGCRVRVFGWLVNIGGPALRGLSLIGEVFMAPLSRGSFCML